MTLDASHVIFKIDNPVEQEVQGLRLVCNFVSEQQQAGGSIGTLVQTPQIYQA
jgi:hypothetical protein